MGDDILEAEEEASFEPGDYQGSPDARAFFERDLRKAYKKLTAEEEAELSSIWQEKKAAGAKTSPEREALIFSCLPLATLLGRRKGHFYRYPQEEGELVAIAALIRAVDSFDSGRGRLSTYVAFCIRTDVSKAAADHHGTNSNYLTTICTSLNKKERELMATDNGRDLSFKDIEEISHNSKVKPELIARLRASVTNGNGRHLPIDTVGDGGEGLYVARDNAASPYDVCAHQQLQTVVANMLKNLSPRERGILFARFWSDPPLSYTDIGDMFGVSFQRIQQIEGAAIKSLRHTFGNEYLLKGIFFEERLGAARPVLTARQRGAHHGGRLRID